jgi:hypothetical protein
MPMQNWMLPRMDGPSSSSSRSSPSTPRTPHADDIAIGSPPTAPHTRLLRPKKESGSSGVSSARVKKEPGTPASFTRVKKEPDVTPGSLAHVKKEPGAPAPPSLKKACRLVEDAALQLEYQAPEEFPGLKAVELASFNEIQPGTLDFVLAWSRQGAKKADAERALRLGLCVNLEEDDDEEEDEAGPS